MSKLNDGSNEVSSEIPDWSREYKKIFEWSPSRSLLASIRDYQRLSLSSNVFNKIILIKWATLRHRVWSAITGADIPVDCQIEGGLLIPHPNGIVIHPEVRIGPNCLIFQQVTIGTRLGFGAPEIGGHVDIGAGAKVLGNIKIGNHACIGANAVVLQDVPTGRTAVGMPARILKQDN
jgi:serine O-acetyltransferase